jgi:hypothetical protein
MSSMYKIFLFALLISSVSAMSQTPLPASFADSTRRDVFGNNSQAFASTDKKWFFSTYGGISTGLSFFNGGNAIIVAAPLGLQLNRRLNNNMYAFTGLSIAPAYVNFNRSFLSSDVNKFYPGSSFSNSFGMYSRAELGLMYVNDARTFSISGSIGVQRSSNPLFNYQPLSATRKNSIIQSNK